MTGFVTLVADRPEDRQALDGLLVSPPEGWRADRLAPGWVLLRSGERPLPLARRPDGTVILGDYFPSAAPVGGPRREGGLDRLLSEGWGRYVALARDGQGLSVLRDPSGGLEAEAWRQGDTWIASSGLPDWLEPWWPDTLAIDWPAVGRILADPALAGWATPLTGLVSLPPGAIWKGGGIRQAWDPAAFARRGVARALDLEAELVATVDAVVARWARGRVLLEVSGGLDSAIVASALRRAGAEVAGAVNYYVVQPEGDERAFARAVAETCGFPLDEVEKPEAALDLDALRAVSGGLRPALDGIDAHHDLDLAERCRRAGATTLLTGRGGDNVFFQTPTPLIAASGGGGGLGLRGLADLARWQGRSVYGLIRAARPGPETWSSTPATDGTAHPWLSNLAGLPSAKRLQIASLVGGIAAQSATRRGEVADLRHPLLAQPLLELCLGIPVTRLVQGGRDRGLARDAFADRLPPPVLARRGKGRLSAHYGRIVARSLGELRPLLLEGRLAAAGLIDRADWESALSVESLIWQGGVGRIFGALMVELWVGAWEARIRRRCGSDRRPRTGIPPPRSAEPAEG